MVSLEHVAAANGTSSRTRSMHRLRMKQINDTRIYLMRTADKRNIVMRDKPSLASRLHRSVATTVPNAMP